MIQDTLARLLGAEPGYDDALYADPLDGANRRERPTLLRPSAEAITHLKGFEALRLTAYDDFRPGHNLQPGEAVRGTLTIGYGHTGPDVSPGDTITEAQADALFERDLRRVAQEPIYRYVETPLEQFEFDALLGFVFNIGGGAFRRSTMLRKLNVGDYDGAAAEFPRWVRSKGRRMQGLVIRRQAEQAMFQGNAHFGFVDIADLAERAEEMLAIGANARPDAEVGDGLMKSKFKSTEIMGGLGGLGMMFLEQIGSIPQPVLIAGIVAFCIYIIFNRIQKSERGVH